MSATSIRVSATVTAIVTSLAVASAAQAGGYAGNGCVAKKQAAAGKFAVSVGKAMDKYAGDTTGLNAAVDKAATKLQSTWTKEETKAVDKGSSCNESTATAGEISTSVVNALGAISGENYLAASGYVGGAMKSWGKYIKDPTKDAGKAKLNDALASASSKYLTGENATVTNAATALLADLVEKTTDAPNYPNDFQTIAFTANQHVPYGKKDLTPGCVDGDPYMFFARKGTSNNVLMYYQGGGACWNNSSCNVLHTCDRVSDESDNPALQNTGFANYNDPDNPFKDWSVVFVSYCSCDIHWGEGQKAYGSSPSFHRGRVNAQVAEKFAREHFLDPDRVFVTGSSAGSYGAIMNSYWLMKDLWPNADFAVMGDAGVGVITKQWLETYINNWGVENNFPEDLPGVEKPVTNLSLVDLIDGLSQRFPSARFANYDSSYDGGSGSQTNFFQVMRHPVEQGGSTLDDWGSWYASACDWNACMKEFKAENSSRAAVRGNYHYFTGAGSRHTIFGSDKVYTETNSRKADGTTAMTFVDWVQAMIDDSADWVDVDCNNNGDCNLVATCQGGTNAGAACTSDTDCAPKTCTSGATAGNSCSSSDDCSGLTCVGGDDDGASCTVNGEKNVECAKGICTHASACTGTCQKDSDASYPPAFNNNGLVACAPTACPCGLANAKCFDGTSEGASCSTNDDCGGGSCSYVNCSNQ